MITLDDIKRMDKELLTVQDVEKLLKINGTTIRRAAQYLGRFRDRPRVPPYHAIGNIRCAAPYVSRKHVLGHALRKKLFFERRALGWCLFSHRRRLPLKI